MSNDYSTKLSRAKNRDIALAIALYHRFGAGSLLQEKLTSSLISTMMTAIRLVFAYFVNFTLTGALFSSQQIVLIWPPNFDNHRDPLDVAKKKLRKTYIFRTAMGASGQPDTIRLY